MGPFWRVVDSVPTPGTHPEGPAAGLVPEQDWPCTGTRVDGCTGTAIGLVPVQSRRPRDPSLGFCNFVGLVPVQEPVYRYKETDFVQFELQGVFRDCGLFITAPTPLRAFFRAGTRGEERFRACFEASKRAFGARLSGLEASIGGSGHAPGGLPLGPGA
uniref:Uncharacterized protein n=1 Tax=Ananas comosus var. bracteatus TaxID=296719 RepID=A0A6V7QH05_ANACO|nr:unnamed protein product [Ananas comosus var. bracteatus]